MMRLEDEMRAYIDSLVQTKPRDKHEIRAALLKRKLDHLNEQRDELRRIQFRAIQLMSKVDYTNIKPRLVQASPKDKPLWNYYRHIVSSAPWNERPGRSNYFFVQDAKSKGILGIVDLGSDLLMLGPRDHYIGWNRRRKFAEGGLNHIVNCGTCVAVAPFGWLTGGKFQIMASASRKIAQLWERRYGDAMAALTTTSLYGKSSVYNRLSGGSIPDHFPDLEYIGNTPGIGVFHLDQYGRRLLKRFLAANRIAARTSGSGGVSGAWDQLRATCAALDIPHEKITTHQPRGVYMALLGENAMEFLRGEMNELAQRLPPEREVADWWLERWYSMRLPKKIAQIEEFDYNVYQVDAQINYCKRQIEKYSRS